MARRLHLCVGGRDGLSAPLGPLSTLSPARSLLLAPALGSPPLTPCRAPPPVRAGSSTRSPTPATPMTPSESSSARGSAAWPQPPRRCPVLSVLQMMAMLRRLSLLLPKTSRAAASCILRRARSTRTCRLPYYSFYLHMYVTWTRESTRRHVLRGFLTDGIPCPLDFRV
jgi:hypothetical protein